MHYSLVIWEEVPENTTLVLIQNDLIDQNGWRAFLEQAHNKLINSDKINDGMEFINHGLMQEQYANDCGEQYKQYVSVLRPYIQDKSQPIVDRIITHVYFAGFVL